MTKEERQYWTSRDPIILFENFLLDQGVFNKDTLIALKNDVDARVEEAVALL